MIMDRSNRENTQETREVSEMEESPARKLDFAYSFRPIQYFSRVFGMFPFPIEQDSNGGIQEPKVRIFDGLWFVASICLRLFLAFYSAQQIKPGRMPFVLIFGGFLTMIMNLVSGALMAGMNMCNRYRILDILKMFDTFDKEVD